jgi:hypothetical protein
VRALEERETQACEERAMQKEQYARTNRERRAREANQADAKAGVISLAMDDLSHYEIGQTLNFAGASVTGRVTEIKVTHFNAVCYSGIIELSCFRDKATGRALVAYQTISARLYRGFHKGEMVDPEMVDPMVDPGGDNGAAFQFHAIDREFLQAPMGLVFGHQLLSFEEAPFVSQLDDVPVIAEGAEPAAKQGGSLTPFGVILGGLLGGPAGALAGGLFAAAFGGA